MLGVSGEVLSKQNRKVTFTKKKYLTSLIEYTSAVDRALPELITFKRSSKISHRNPYTANNTPSLNIKSIKCTSQM